MNARPRVSIVAPRKPGEGPGGAERHLQDLDAVLSSLGADVRFVSAADAPQPTAVERLLARAFPLLSTPLSARRLARSGALEGSDIVLSVELMGYGVRAARHLHLFFGSYAGFRKRALQRGGPVASLVTGIARILENGTQGRDGAVANSLGLRDVLVEEGVRVRPEIIPPPTDTELFRPSDQMAARRRLGLPEQGRLLLFAGRWEYAKGADRVEALLPSLPDGWKVLLACPSRTDRPWPACARMIRLLDVPRDRMPLVYAASDALLQPSRFEGYSLVVSEAQACGCPVVTSPVGHFAHLLQGPVEVAAGVVRDPDRPAAWIEALTAIAATPGMQARSARAARSYAEQHVSRSQIASEWFSLLSRLYPEFEWHPPR